MRITPPTIPHHLMKAYGVAPAAKPAPVRSTEAIARVGAADQHSTGEAVKKLIAGVVPGGVDFSGEEPMPSAPQMAMYRHPADKNAAATSVHAGRMLDIEG